MNAGGGDPPFPASGPSARTVRACEKVVPVVHVAPFADLRNLEYVQVLTGGPERPGVPG